MPRAFTYCSLSKRYFIGVAINNNRYEVPSNIAINLKILFNVNSTAQIYLFYLLQGTSMKEAALTVFN